MVDDEVVFVSFVPSGFPEPEPYEAPICPICFGDIVEQHCAIFRCKHRMHAACFKDFRKAGYDRCPLCRTVIIPPTKCQHIMDTRRFCKNAAANGTEFCTQHGKK